MGVVLWRSGYPSDRSADVSSATITHDDGRWCQKALRSGTLRVDTVRCSHTGIVCELTERLENLIAGKDDYFRAKGVVVETLPNATFRVKLETGHEVTARASGKMRKGRMIRIIPGDSVEVDVSAYDPTMGRIIWRYR